VKKTTTKQASKKEKKGTKVELEANPESSDTQKVTLTQQKKNKDTAKPSTPLLYLKENHTKERLIN